MTYCVALRLKAGLVMLSDTRTNAGVDNISRFRKMFTWSAPGERAVAMMTAGNLAVTQSVISRLEEAIADPNYQGDTVLNAPSIYRIAEIVGGLMQDAQSRWGSGVTAMSESMPVSDSGLCGSISSGEILRIFPISPASSPATVFAA